MHRHRFNLIVLCGFVVGLVWAAAMAQPAPDPSAITVRPLALSAAIRGADRLTGGPAIGSPRALSHRLAAPDSNIITDHLDFGRIGGIALISRELDQYGRIRGVDFLSYRDPDSHWDMKLNVKHGAMLQFTRHWGGSASGDANSGAVSDNR